jgi:hypothetical protein
MAGDFTKDPKKLGIARKPTIMAGRIPWLKKLQLMGASQVRDFHS